MTVFQEDTNKTILRHPSRLNASQKMFSLNVSQIKTWKALPSDCED